MKTDEIQAFAYDWEGRTILLVEDDEYSIDYIGELLSLAKADCEHAINGIDAMRLYKSMPHIDLVLMDIRLPDINGYDLTRSMHQINPDIPIIAQTAYSYDTDREKAMEAGCVDFMTKPISQSKLFITLDEYLHKKSPN